jgi:hypothetical protein
MQMTDGQIPGWLEFYKQVRRDPKSKLQFAQRMGGPRKDDEDLQAFWLWLRPDLKDEDVIFISIPWLASVLIDPEFEEAKDHIRMFVELTAKHFGLSKDGQSGPKTLERASRMRLKK